jgi:hypothetical protein
VFIHNLMFNFFEKWGTIILYLKKVWEVMVWMK